MSSWASLTRAIQHHHCELVPLNHGAQGLRVVVEGPKTKLDGFHVHMTVEIKHIDAIVLARHARIEQQVWLGVNDRAVNCPNTTAMRRDRRYPRSLPGSVAEACG